jgi:aldose 1-epimerase
MTIALRSAGLEAHFQPYHGGRLVSLRHERLGHILHPLAQAITDPLDWPKGGAFPLLPFHGRLKGGWFSDLGETYVLTGNPFKGGDALHGPAQRRPWAVDGVTHASLDLGLDYVADRDWPFSFRAEQHFTIDRCSLTVTLVICNTGHSDMPAGLGWHPYFACDVTTDVYCDASTRWLNIHMPEQGGSREAREDKTAPIPRHPFTDHVSGWTQVTLALASGVVSLSASDVFSHVVLHRTADYMCVEPVTHVAGVFALAPEMREQGGFLRLSPGQCLSGMVTVFMNCDER